MTPPNAPAAGQPTGKDPTTMSPDELMQLVGIDDLDSPRENDYGELEGEQAQVEAGDEGEEQAGGEGEEQQAEEEKETPPAKKPNEKDESEEEGDQGESAEAKTDEEQPKEAPKRAAQFGLVTTDGQEVEYPEDVLFTLKHPQTGKEIKLPTDKVVRLALSGFHNEELEAARDELVQRNTYLEEQHVPALVAQVQQLQTAIFKMLEDPEKHFDPAKTAFDKAQTPEAKAERDRQRQEIEAEQAELQKDYNDWMEFFKAPNGIVAALAEIHAPYKDLVTHEELVDKFAAMTRHLQIRDPQKPKAVIVPKRNHERLLRIVRGDLARYADTVYATRLSQVDGKVAKEKKAAADAKDKAEKATKQTKAVLTLQKKRFIRGAVPRNGKVTPPGRQPANSSGKRSETKSADESINRIIGDALSELTT